MGSASTFARPAQRVVPASEPAAPDVPAPWSQSTWTLAALGNLLFWAALPPLAIGPLAWFAPLPWLMLVRQRALLGRRPYAVLWLASFAFHLATLYWLTLPHWATAFGWVALSIYLAIYLPAFVGLSRVAVHALGISPIVAAPVVWAGLELARGHFMGGFGMVSLAHTQVHWPIWLQISDLFGSYGLSFLIVLVAACIARMLPSDGAPRVWWPALPLAAALLATAAYGDWRMTEQQTRPGPKVALVQGSIDIDMKYDPEQGQQIFDEYFGLTRQAVKEHGTLDLIVWPETMFRYPWFTFDEKYVPPADARFSAAEASERSRLAVEHTVAPLRTPFLLGVETVHNAQERYNSALFADRDGKLLGRYDKCHLVPFGEFVPFAETFPWLYQLTPLPSGLNAGAGPQSVEIGQTRYAPNICYEDTIPHLIRAQVLQLRAEHREPDVLVNLTNDGWFWGSSELDMHLACGVFRAVECRKPVLIAANTGFSAWIDSNGRIRAQGRRRAPDLIVAATRIDRRGSWYLDHGDIPAGLCLLATCGLAAVGLVRWKRQRSHRVS